MIERKNNKIDELKKMLNNALGKCVKDTIEEDKIYNSPWNPFDDGFTEKLHACMYNTKCSGSAGLGWDTIDKGESKYSSRVQSRKCNSCGAKVMFFLDTCPECSSTDLKQYPKDSRWNISSKAHIDYYDRLKGYRLTLLEPKEFTPNCEEFRLRSWFVETKNEYLTKYAYAQLNSSKSNGINFMPLGRDFYYSSPCLHLDVNITYDGAEIVYFNIENDIPEKIPSKFLTNKSINDIINNKTFGKDRGKIARK
tara:strand:- start:1297 stop:2052 length:756 start_codon:yes stop_codon:yes gene_type:complete